MVCGGQKWGDEALSVVLLGVRGVGMFGGERGKNGGAGEYDSSFVDFYGAEAWSPRSPRQC